MNSKKKLRDWLLEHQLYPYAERKFGVWRTITSPFRKLPNFLIIGAARCGTTSLYDYISQHPAIIGSIEKEPAFFSFKYKTGVMCYKAQFPLKISHYFRKTNEKNFITCEASTIYLLDPNTPLRVNRMIPNAKFIIILRNPVDRAYSNFNFQTKLHRETRTFEGAIRIELARIKEGQNLENSHNIENLSCSYVIPGIYADQIKNWLNYFPKKQFFIIEMEELTKNPNVILQEIFNFLGQENFLVTKLEPKNVGNYQKMDQEIRKLLLEFYSKHNERLYKIIGRRFDWEK